MSVASVLSSPLSRRFFLSRGAAISTVGLPAIGVPALASVPAAAAALSALMQAARSSETPELLALGAELPGLRKGFAVASERWREAKAAALASDPPVPDELRPSHTHPIFGGMSWGFIPREIDIIGRERPLEPHPTSVGMWRTFPVLTAEYIKDVRDGHIQASRQRRQELARYLDIAERYEAGREKVIVEIGLREARRTAYWSAYAISQACRAGRELEAKTVLGVLIKAQLISASLEVGDESGRSAALHASEPFAQAVCDVLGSAEALS